MTDLDLPTFEPESISTERLTLRQWTAADREPFARINADPEVMRHFPNPLTREQSDAMADIAERRIRHNGWGLWVVDLDGDFIGFTGFAVPSFDAPFTPAVEIGWRFARSAWGNGYATEAARAALEVGFTRLGLKEVVSFTTVGNAASRNVMNRLGMLRDPADDFDHPRLPEDSPQRRHVLYRLGAPA